ncbi:serine hydrolase domain-containing protein [Hymenobacter negativus]|uniref:Serine hydrolase n=1 Tax=Hymenobacter negativus TaxID=2795026 RepID=A0ABS3QKD3_9BACT|nr:serine hydrolase [Hymenobacter negativus]MBO2011713.1 serine hydrolase [Hymenobacter negativus]
MKKWVLLLLLGFTSARVFAQAPFARTLVQLQEYQGLYEYENRATLQMAASPRDLVLYAIIADARYALHAVGPDSFADGSNNAVQFQRDASGKVISYTLKQQVYRRLKGNLNLPPQMWSPRPLAAGQPFVYRYTAPPKTTDGLPVGTLQNTGLDPALLATMVTKIVDGSLPNIHSVLVLQNGRLVFEEYFYEYDRETLHSQRSATKSVISALTGIAIEQGFIKSVQEPVAAYFPEYKLRNDSPEKQRISIENMLANQSGLDCDIANEQSVGNETTMDHSPDWVKYTLDLPLSDHPGGKGMYCSGNPITVGRIIEKQARQPLPDFARQVLFGPLGIKNFDWRFQPDSTSADTYCQLSLRPRDMAKFGLLYLNQGQWQGQQLVPAAWVSASLAQHSVVQGVSYGYLWWLKYLDVAGRRYHGAMAQGNGGQRISVWPEQKLVVIVTGGNFNQQSPSDEMIGKYVLAAFK